MVATDYEKAKSLFSNTQVPIFKRVLEEVEKQIAKFREDLRVQLLVLPMTLDQQKKLIK
jgi:exocyst complex component 2